MNCLNHPEVAASAYCQNCGKPLCTACIRSVGGQVFCETCLAARVAGTPVAGASLHANPLLAGLLGFIPGVGAMYNGQFVKALAHVLIFAVFVSLSDRSSFFGLLVAAWVFYQVFDAAQTAKARRDGMPLPNPFGLNDLGNKLGVTPASAPYSAGFPSPPPSPPPPQYPGPMGSAPASGFAPSDPNVPFGSYTAPSPGAPPVSGVSGMPPGYVPPLPPEPSAHRTPVGAIVLIVIGVVLLLQTLGIFEDEWIHRSWPLIIIGVGAWLFYRRTRDLPPGGPR
jgi:Domain of unknown function (DUF5668)/B-box zinc finger